MTLILKQTLLDAGLSQAGLAARIHTPDGRGLSAASVAQIVNHDAWPRSIGRAGIERQIRAALAERGVTGARLKQIFRRAGAAGPVRASAQDHLNPEELIHMLLRKQPLTQEACRHFNIKHGNPFNNEMRDAEDVYLSDDTRYVRARMRQTAQHGGMLAVVGESGAGKSIIRRDLKSWISAERLPIAVIEPYVLGMADNDRHGRPLHAMDIAISIIRGIGGNETPKRNAQERNIQLHQLLKNSAKTGYHHVLVIEEAHALAIPTLKSMKSFYEMETESGFGDLLSIILIGQNELARKLDDRNPNVREVVQRCEIATLAPLDQQVHAYLKHKFARVGLDYNKIFDASAIEEIQSRLRVSAVDGRGAGRRTITRSLCYPLAVNNLASMALNQAARIGAPIITRELIAAAMRAQTMEI